LFTLTVKHETYTTAALQIFIPKAVSLNTLFSSLSTLTQCPFYKDYPLKITGTPTNQRVVTPAVYFFLLGCMALPFFNDFPLLIKISESFRNLSTPFFSLAGLFLLFECLLPKQYLKITYPDIYFVLVSIILVWISVLCNINKSGSVCGVNICGAERMMSAGLGISVRLGLLLGFIHLIRTESMNRISRFIRLGFYLSFLYVLLELINSYIPYYLGYASPGLLNSVQGYFHLRIGDIAPNRTRGLAFEPSYQGVFLIICLPFLVADPISGRRLRNIFAWMVCLITSTSLTGLAAASTFFIIYKLKGVKLFMAMVSILIIFAALSTYFLSSHSNLKLLDIYGTGFVSTITRAASWVAGIYAVANNYVFGVGPGMAGYWVTNYYPGFSALSSEMPAWYHLGRTTFDAPTFASLLTFILDYGVVPFCIAIAYLFYTGVLQDALRSRIGRASIIALLVASLGLDGYEVWGYWLFLAMILSRSWGRLDVLADCVGGVKNIKPKNEYSTVCSTY